LIGETCQRLFGLIKQNGNVPQYLTGKVISNEKSTSLYKKR
jgi:hypothetical protein